LYLKKSRTERGISRKKGRGKDVKGGNKEAWTNKKKEQGKEEGNDGIVEVGKEGRKELTGLGCFD
jgi:hypothetical protein